MKILFPSPSLTITMATLGQYKNGMSVWRRLVIRPAGWYVATESARQFSINALAFANGFSEVKNGAATYGFNSGRVILTRVRAYQNFNCPWEKTLEGVKLNDYAGEPPGSVAADTRHIFSSSKTNNWHNSLVLNNKTNKTSATVVFGSTTLQNGDLTMDLI